MRRSGQQKIILVKDGAGGICYQGRPEEMRFPEAVILRLSIDFFDDPSPCFIHRSAVIARIAEELRAGIPAGELCRVFALPDPLPGYFAGYPKAETVQIMMGE